MLVTVERRLYPQSEELFNAQMAQAAEVGARVTKLAFADPRSPFPDPLREQEVIATGNMQAILDTVWSEKVAQSRLPFLRQQAAVTGDKGQYWRFFAVSEGPGSREGKAPDIHSDYPAWLALHFACYNGPYGGERAYFLPEDISRAAGMLDLPLEVQLAERGRELLSAVGVAYEEETIQVAFREAYPLDHEVTRQALEVSHTIRWILDYEEDMEAYRVPYVRPPEEVRRRMEQQKLQLRDDGPYLEDLPHDIHDVLPPAFR